MTHPLYIVIVGCGRLGADLANQLSRAGPSVVMIDSDDAAFGALSVEFSGFRVAGDATQQAVLAAAKLPQADVLFATTHSDNINLMVAEIARRLYHVPQAIARIYDPQCARSCASLNVDAICPTAVAAEMFLLAVADGVTKEEAAV